MHTGHTTANYRNILNRLSIDRTTSKLVTLADDIRHDDDIPEFTASIHSQGHIIMITASTTRAGSFAYPIKSKSSQPLLFPTSQTQTIFLPRIPNLATTNAIPTHLANTHHVPPPRCPHTATSLAFRSADLLQHTRPQSRQNTSSSQQHASQCAKSRQDADPRRGLAVKCIHARRQDGRRPPG